MPNLVHEPIFRVASVRPRDTALLFKGKTIDYGALAESVQSFANGVGALGIAPGDRIAVYLPKQPETVYALFGAAAAGATFVPVNPLLKPRQVGYILDHCEVRVLVTSAQRLAALGDTLSRCESLRAIVVVDDPPAQDTAETGLPVISLDSFCDNERVIGHRRIDRDMAAILYTSGSTGNPKGVVLSHANMLAGAASVAEYLGNVPEDRILAVLPLSFDAGLSQLTTAFHVGASAVLMDYLLPRDVIRAAARYGVTGLAAVPPLWNQLVGLEWPAEVVDSLRYITNTGGAMPKATTRALREALPNTDVVLMYGLTEAFRSTYLPPDQVDIRADSIGKAIPNAEIMVVNEAGHECDPGEPGELVHRGALVAMGYWNDPEKTAQRFKPCPGQPAELPITELAVWSGDQVVRDEEGFLYFINRKDEMIKTSGYRVSPTEIEEVVYSCQGVAGAVAIGLAHPTLGQAILLLVTGAAESAPNPELRDLVLSYCRQELPNYMVPHEVILRETLPQNQNGKIDRRSLAGEYGDIFRQ